MTTEAEEKALRYRRAQSVTRAEEITEKEKKARRLQVDKPYVANIILNQKHLLSILYNSIKFNLMK